MADIQIKGIRVNGKLTDLNISEVITHLTSPNGTDYIIAVDDNGNLFAYNPADIPSPLTPPTEPGAVLSKFYINEFYCGGKNADEHTVNYCSHNFVELSNLTKSDINLEGMSLQYAISSTDWAVLPLKGVIKAGSTFVIRGAQCSVIDSPLTKIHVDNYDMEWYQDGELIKFDSSVSAKFYLTFNLAKYAGVNPYSPTTSAVTSDAIGYVDLVGVKGTGNPEGFEGTVYSNGLLSNTRLYRKYYAMDPVKQATKAINARNNANDWYFVDLTKDDGELIPSIEVYTPMASFENKNMFYNKTKMVDFKPSMITCSFGIQATDGGNGKRATRCFNWLTKNTDNKYIWVRAKNAASWGEAHESFCEGDGRSAYATANERVIYDRKIKEYTNNTIIIVNKFILNNLSAGEYEYVAGSKNSDGTPDMTKCTDIRSFVVKTDENVNTNGFKFVQTSDQQGFNWEEYRVWNAAAKNIVSEYPDVEFMINTGDMTQNGNRMGEWLDYFNGKDDILNNMPEMATIGNNDLSLNTLYKIGLGEDNEKLWHENITFFYTFESDVNNLPIFKGYDEKDYYIPSLYSFNYGNVHFLCFNTEIKKTTETNADGYNFGDGHFGVFYPQMKEWCEKDMENVESNWNIAYCHEMPFTILIPSVAQADESKIPTERTGGSNANENVPKGSEYWFSEFCQTHNIPVVLGGHKHTQSTSWSILENVKYDGDVRTVDSMHPIIVVNETTLGEFSGATSLVEYEGYKYPNSWFNGDILKDACKKMVHLCTFEMEENVPSGLTPVTYCMSQATGYKHTSNKELPSPDIPWLRYYFPADTTSKGTVASPAVNAFQKFPFFTIWTIENDSITGEIRKTYGAFNDKGKFDINLEYPYVKRGYSAVEKNNTTMIHSINGITSMENSQAEIDTRIITIVK